MERNKIKRLKIVDDAPTRELYVQNVIDRTGCLTHQVLIGQACWSFQAAENDSWHRGICNSRAKRAGFNGAIHPSSLDRTYGLRARAS